MTLCCWDVEGDCCGSCHDEWDAGWGSPHEIYQSNVLDVPYLSADPLVGESCCKKYEAVLAALKGSR